MQEFIVIDFGKSRVKIFHVSSKGKILCEYSLNTPLKKINGIDSLDVELIEVELLKVIKKIAINKNFIKAIIPIAHGAAFAAISKERLIFPVIDYESSQVNSVDHEYEESARNYNETFSPRLSNGLNLGRQLFWLENKFPHIWKEVDSILLYPQYWAWRLSGVMVSEITSLACHTDLWNPLRSTFSKFAINKNWERLFPPINNAWEVLGPIKAEIYTSTGLSKDCLVLAGAHDSSIANSYFISSIDKTTAEQWAIISTGTWFVLMWLNYDAIDRLNGPINDLSQDVFKNLIATERFMGGRHVEKLLGAGEDCKDQSTLHEISLVIKLDIFYVVNEYGELELVDEKNYILSEDYKSIRLKRAALMLYLALMSNYLLEKMNFSGNIIIEGFFSKYCDYQLIMSCLWLRGLVYKLAGERRAIVEGAIGLFNIVPGHLHLEYVASNSIDGLSHYKEKWSKKAKLNPN